MKRHFLLALSLFSATLFGQRQFEFESYLQPDVTRNGSVLQNGFAVGMNNPQFSPIDMNLDGVDDLLVFDRDGDILLPYLTVGSGTNTHYEFAPDYIDSFPQDMISIVHLVDFNCDGKRDIFYKVVNGVGVYENTSTNGKLSFDWALGNDPLLTCTFANGQTSQVYVLSTDIPVFDDVDGDGDIDILSFEFSGTQINFYENTSSNNCGLEYYLKQECWGGFREDPNNNGVQIDACIPGGAPPIEPETGMHAGSTILSIDLDNDGLEEIILGDISFPESVMLPNSGTADSAYVGSQVNNWAPDGQVPIDLYVFPALYNLDLTFDGIPDLVAAPNIMPSKNVRQVWMYENIGTTANPTYAFRDSSFLQSSMIDLGEGAFPTFVDINGDGLQDIVVGNRGEWVSGGNYESSLWYLKNTTVGSNISFEVVSENFASFSGITDPLSPIPTFADMDNDGDYDMVVGFEDGKLGYYENTGSIINPSFTLINPNYAGIDVGQNAAPELFDMNGDGLMDLLVGEKTGNVNYYQNNGNGFTLVSENFGGINRDRFGQLQGYAVPRMYVYNNVDQLMVGSEYLGVAQFDSAQSIVSQPSVHNGQFGTASTSTTTPEETPFGATKRTGRNQFLYRASELQAQGLTYGQIEKIEFNVTTTNTSNSITNGITIRMKNTDSTELNGFHTGLTTVYDYNMPISPGWNDVTLSTPFVWDGTSNVVVEICYSRNLPLVDNAVEATDVGFKSNAYGDYTGWNNNTSNGCNMPYGGVSTLRPNTRFTLRPITPAAGNILDGYHRMNADFADLDNDNYPEAIIGTFNGGLILMKGQQLTIGIEEERVNPHLEASIYPNPTQGRFTVALEDESSAEYKVFDLNGRLQRSGQFEGRTDIDLSNLANGVYILHVLQDQQSSYAKIIKQ